MDVVVVQGSLFQLAILARRKSDLQPVTEMFCLSEDSSEISPSADAGYRKIVHLGLGRPMMLNSILDSLRDIQGACLNC